MLQYISILRAGREDIRTQFERDAVDAIDSDAFMEEHASSMPRDLKEPQQLYAMAVCVAEVAGTHSDPAYPAPRKQNYTICSRSNPCVAMTVSSHFDGTN